MIYLKVFPKHTSYESELNVGGEDFEIPNVSYCDDADDIHYNPYNTVEFYVGEITGTTPQTVKIYTDTTNFDEVIVSEGNKWYSYLLPKNKGLCKIESGLYDDDSEEWTNGIVTKAVVKANINYHYDVNNETYNGIVPWEITEASFKGTSKVTDMSSMFYYCSGLTSLDLSGLDTSKVKLMSNMFNNCSKLTSLDLRNFNTSNVTIMTNMFGSCKSLTSLDLSNFDTSKVTDMGSMFNSCSGLTSLDLSNFNTSNVTNMNGMFNGCSGLTSLDLSGLDTSKVTNMDYMFAGCSKLSTIRMVGCNSTTVDKIKSALTSAEILNQVTIIT